MNTFEDKFNDLWDKFVTFSNDPNNTDAEVIEAEVQHDKDVEELRLKFSHPPGRPNRRR